MKGEPSNADAAGALLRALDSASVGVQETVADREAAVRRSGELLSAGGKVDPDYTDEMLAVLAQHGPYIVIAPGIALAHSRPSAAVHGVAFSLLTLDPPVEFGEPDNDPVRLVVGMAAPDADSHVAALREAAELLADDRRREMLMEASSVEEMLAVVAEAAEQDGDRDDREQEG